MTDTATTPGELPRATLEALARATGAQRSFVEELLRELVLRDPDGAALSRVDAGAAARGAVDHVLDASQRWTDHLGGFYDVDGVRRLLSRSGRLVSKQGAGGPRQRLRGWRSRTTPLVGDDDLLAELRPYGTGVADRPFDVPVVAPG